GASSPLPLGAAAGERRPSSTPFASPLSPHPTPAMRPATPAREVRSPAVKRRKSFIGQPINTAQPTIRKNPEANRNRGALPPLERNSLRKSALANAPSTNPTSSGRRY